MKPYGMRRAGTDEAVDEVTAQVVDAAVEVRRVMGAGLMEKIYQASLANELTARGLVVEREVEVPVSYKGAPLGTGLRLDLLVNGVVIVEVKAVETFHAVHFAQLLTYLRLARRPVGLLINFSAVPFREGIRRLLAPEPVIHDG